MVGHDVTKPVQVEPAPVSPVQEPVAPEVVAPVIEPTPVAPVMETPVAPAPNADFVYTGDVPTAPVMPGPVVPDAVPEVSPITFDTVQPIEPEVPDLSVQNAINSELVTPQAPVAPAVEPAPVPEPVMETPTRAGDPYVSLNIKLESIRNEFNRKLESLKEEFNKKIIDEISREVENLRIGARSTSVPDMTAVNNEINAQYSAMNEQLNGYTNAR